MFGLGFLAPLFVAAGIVGASIPIILHLLNRERARRLVFSTVRFIQMSHQTNVRRHKLKRLLLLLMRILILAFLGVAFARPFFAAAPIISQKVGGKRNAIIILDTSYSMQYEEAFQNAREEKFSGRLDSTDAAATFFNRKRRRVSARRRLRIFAFRTASWDARITYSLITLMPPNRSEILESYSYWREAIYLIGICKTGWKTF